MGSNGSTQNEMKNKEYSNSYAKAAKVATWPADKKTMKAPGMEGTRMYRNDFEDNPKHYFQKLRHDDQKRNNGSTQNEMKNKEYSNSYAKAAKVATWPADKKTMKAPGREGTRMYRNDFEDNPKRYFQKLHHDDQKRKHSK
ncbi:hypothetical protein I3842_06G142500 [Carya illinoinensis]|uniref:Uncharacterized protein n=1 Tax=Carya illinoinensis TaxID=32201 RepID=A0A922ET91_CARIL|nr:hypothetical protein I3842_06G142500 [Carya illinoinensis]